MKSFKWLARATVVAASAVLLGAPLAQAASVSILNVSYDPTRELYVSYNAEFAKYWKAKTGDDVHINQSHGGSGKQARAVIEGLPADVVTLALAGDVDAIASRGKLLPLNWQSRLPDNSAPYTSTIVFLVRKGNPKGIKDWGDLIKPGIAVITPNPKTSGGARWNYLAAWRGPNICRAAMTPRPRISSTSSTPTFRYSTPARAMPRRTFVQRGIGDVLVAWENEAFLAIKEVGADKLQIVVPSLSILAEPSVAVVDQVALKHSTTPVATEYLKHLYSKEAQEIIAQNFYRPRDPDVAKKYENQFPKLQLVTIAEFGGWTKAAKDHFDDGGNFDQIYGAK